MILVRKGEGDVGLSGEGDVGLSGESEGYFRKDGRKLGRTDAR